MWEILDYTIATSSHKPTYQSPSAHSTHSPKLFHESLFPAVRTTPDDSQTVVETQIFHVPAAEPDTSDGGQAMPPYAGHAINSNNTSTTPIHNQHTASTPQQQQD